MKRISRTIIAGLLLTLLLTACAGPASGALTPVRIATDPTFPPFEQVDRDSRTLVGFDMDVMRAIGDRARLNVDFVSTSYNILLGSVASCEVDGAISAMAISDDLKATMSFSDPYYSVGQVVVVKKGNLTITGRDTLAGMAVGAQQGDPGAAELQKIPGVQPRLYDSVEMAFQDLIIGLLDAVIADYPQALSYASTPANNLQLVGSEFASKNYGIAVCSRNPAVLQKINAGLAAIKADGTIARLEKKWIVQGGQ